MQEVAEAMSRVANTVVAALAEKLTGHDVGAAAFPPGCDEMTCFFRLNRYPTSPIAADTFGLVPHTDNDFLTVLCQDQAWSNDTYKSVEHKVVANAKSDRLSIAYFLCPSYDAFIGTCGEPSPYRAFTFVEYRSKVQEDVRRTGKKIGLPNFLKRSLVQ
ncbi:hypothetical protein GUJ93_ZPchr0004g39538 [Zizania palustris]|uniref:Isopenicillin N synthase-like Fe(2+) 2OG dioxygenase domain-containing protein n=1 Tax=Zizania palustris TaxID=103762 RepID=A0A8J5SCG9_ZIZPA|nr:hypothetical protein GUJ93_ZPchr0004g39538 [Zizania palustris]